MNFTCSYCGRISTITGPNYDNNSIRISVSEYNIRLIRLGFSAIVCPNKECGQLELDVRLSKESINDHSEAETLNSWKLLPASKAKPQPDYIPKSILDDYYESCAILKDSPKASATLARRCLQGIVRDFWQLDESKKGKLAAELKQIKNLVDEDIWSGIDAIVTVGNIGAHMEKDVNYVVDIEEEEADLLIDLIEMLFEDWYVTRHRRKMRAERAKEVAKKKIGEKRAAKVASKSQS